MLTGRGTLEFCPGPMLRCSDYFKDKPDYFETHRFAAGSEPLRSRMLFIDELNRISETTLSVLLEAMAQNRVQIPSLLATPRQTTLPGFFLVAAQNPSHHVGVGMVPEAILDRFMVRLDLKTPTSEITGQILAKHVRPHSSVHPSPAAGASASIQLLPTSLDVEHIRRQIRKVPFDRDLLEINVPALQQACQSRIDATDETLDTRRRIRDLVDPVVNHGFGLRGMFSLIDLSQTYAWARTDGKVTLEHARWAAPHTLNHRIQFKEGRLPRLSQQMEFVRTLCDLVWSS